MFLSVIIPVYSEIGFIGEIIKKVNESLYFYFCYYMGKPMVALLSDMFTGLNLTDMETGYF